MRIPNQVLFLGKRQWPEFDCSEAPLPDRLILQLWMLDGAERRYHLAKRWLLGWHNAGPYEENLPIFTSLLPPHFQAKDHQAAREDQP